MNKAFPFLYSAAFFWIGFSAVLARADVELPEPVQVEPIECKVSPQPALEVIPSDQVSGDYWTNMMGNDVVMFTNTNGVSGRFQGFDLKNKVPVRLTTRIDPFPAPDGRPLYIHPSPIKFLDYNQVKKRIENGDDPDKLSESNFTYGAGVVENQNPKSAVRFTDSDIKVSGYYESLASLENVKKEGDNHSTYRVLTGQGEGSIKDYQVTFGPKDELLKVEAKSSAVMLCPNMRGKPGSVDSLGFDTPIISPKGDEFAVTSRVTGSTVVLKFDPKTGDCKKVLDLGFEAGKVHFSPDGSKLAFHATVLSHSGLPKPYLFDRKTNQLKSLEVGNPSDRSQGTFPTFRPDGKIVYQRVNMNYSSGKATKDWVVVDPSHFRSVSMKPTANSAMSCSPLQVDPSMVKLRMLWEEFCSKTAKGENGLLWAMTVDPEVCKSFVTKVSTTFQPDAQAILLAACPKTKIIPTRGARFTSHGVKQTYPRLIETRCAVCHVPGSPHGYIPFDNPEAMRTMKAIGSSAGPGQPFEGKSFLDQVKGILKENIAGHTPPPGIPVVPADGPRLAQQEADEILNWMQDGKKGQYKAPPYVPRPPVIGGRPLTPPQNSSGSGPVDMDGRGGGMMSAPAPTAIPPATSGN